MPCRCIEEVGRGHVRGHGSGGPTVRALMTASADARGHKCVLGECQLLAVAHTHTLLFGRLGPHRNRVRRHAPKREGNSLLLEERSHAPRITVSRHSKYAVAAAIRRIRSMQGCCAYHAHAFHCAFHVLRSAQRGVPPGATALRAGSPKKRVPARSLKKSFSSKKNLFLSSA